MLTQLKVKDLVSFITKLTKIGAALKGLLIASVIIGVGVGLVSVVWLIAR